MIQLLIPFAITTVLWVAFGLLGVIIEWIGNNNSFSILIKTGKFLQVNIFHIEDNYGFLIPESITFWIISIIIIIFLELSFTSHADEDEL